MCSHQVFPVTLIALSATAPTVADGDAENADAKRIKTETEGDDTTAAEVLIGFCCRAFVCFALSHTHSRVSCICHL